MEDVHLQSVDEDAVTAAIALVLRDGAGSFGTPADEKRASDGRVLIPYETISPDIDIVLRRCQTLLAADR